MSQPTPSTDEKGISTLVSGESKPEATYYGNYTDTQNVGLRIANGGAGQAGLIGAWADAFINYMVKKGHKAFTVQWFLGDTTESIALLETKVVDVAVTYNEAAERQLWEIGALSHWLYGFRDHFYLVGPPDKGGQKNSAGLETTDDILTMIKKIVRMGNAQVDDQPPKPPPTRFLSRFDKSATNIKESELFIKIGQVPWAYAYSKWYHQYPRFPIQALEAASRLGEYTLSDQGIWLSSTDDVRRGLQIYKNGKDDEKDPLLNPAHILVAKKENLLDADIGEEFVKWVQLCDEENKDGGQYVVKHFTGNKQTTKPFKPLYGIAPPDWSPPKQ